MSVNAALLAAHPARLEELNQSEITQYLHAIVHALGWRLHEIIWRDRPMTFHWADAEYRNVRFAILIGADAHFLALSSLQSRDGAQDFRFFDDARFTAAAPAEWRVLAAADLNRDLTGEDVAFLHAADARMAYNLDYWRPRTAGQVVFNWWD